MRYGDKDGGLTFTEAVLREVDRDGRPLVPAVAVPLPMPFFKNIAEMSACDVAYVVANAMTGNDFKAEELQHLVEEWIDRDAALAAAGESIYALEPLAGPTMSEYDVVGALPAILLRNCFDHGLVSVDTVFFCPSRADSCAAFSRAFIDKIGQSPVMFQPAGALSETEKQQVAGIVPYDKLYIVTCNDNSLVRLCRKTMASIESPDNEFVLISDDNAACVLARVVMFFEAYRQLCLKGIADSVVICADGSNDGDTVAARVALKLGLPVRFIFSEPVIDNEAVIAAVYKESGYILCPRSVARWKALRGSLNAGETGVFVQQSHPAKYRERLEVLLNRVIMQPLALSFKETPGVRYHRVAPSVHAIRNCLTGRSLNEG